MARLSRRLALVVLLAAGASGRAQTPTASTYLEEIAQWRAAREARLRSDTGWLTVVGLSWLHDGGNTFGSGPENEIRLPPSVPAWGGTIELRGGKTRYLLAPGVSATADGAAAGEEGVLRPDSEGPATLLELGPVSLQIIKRGARYGVRVKDKDAEARKHFMGVEWYDASPAWRIVARFVPHAKPQTIGIANVLGDVEQLPSPGYAEFTLGGRTLRLDPVIEEPGDTELFYILRDRTSGHSTYGAGRFLYSPPPKDGTVVLDFNKAYSPPCAFTRFATCPLPPERNRLDAAIEAGERFLGTH